MRQPAHAYMHAPALSITFPHHTFPLACLAAGTGISQMAEEDEKKVSEALENMFADESLLDIMTPELHEVPYFPSLLRAGLIKRVACTVRAAAPANALQF